jgi:hypothetical protein
MYKFLSKKRVTFVPFNLDQTFFKFMPKTAECLAGKTQANFLSDVSTGVRLEGVGADHPFCSLGAFSTKLFTDVVSWCTVSHCQSLPR